MKIGSIFFDKPSNFFNRPETSDNAVGQISGQFRKPKNTIFVFDEFDNVKSLLC